MRSPLDQIGRRPKRSPFGNDLHIYKPPKPARSLRAKVILATFMGVATLATGLFIHVKLSQKPGIVAVAETAKPAAHEEPALATTEAPASVETASLVKPTMVKTVSVPAEPVAPEPGVDPDALGHNDPRWGRAAQDAAAAKAKSARIVEPAPAKPVLEKAEEPSLAYATSDGSVTRGKADEDVTAAIAPEMPQPLTDEKDGTADAPSAGRMVRIAKAVNLRASPRSGSRVIKVLPAGATIGLVSCDGWCEVTFQGSRGFIYKSFIPGGSSAKVRVTLPKPFNTAQKKPVPPFRQVTQR